MSVVVTFSVIIGASALISATHTFPVTLIVGGEAREINIHADTVAGLLQRSGVVVNDGDTVSPDLDTPLDAGAVVRVDRARSVNVSVDGETTSLWTTLTSPAEILVSAGVSITAGDRLLINGTLTDPAALSQWTLPVSSIDVRHPVTLRIHDEGQLQTVETTASTVGEALFEAGITLYLTDSAIPNLNTPLSDDLDVIINRANPVEIIADGTTIRTRSPGATIAEALAAAGITLVGMDYAIPAEATRLYPGMSIRVIRVREEIETQQETLPFETVYQPDNSLELDTQQVSQAGQEGVREMRTRVRYENGFAVGRTTDAPVIVRAPVNRVIGYGTNVVIRTVETPEGPREYWRKLRMYATSYHPAALGGDNITATGRTLQKGIIGADPDILPYHTQIYVPNYGIGSIEDTGGPRSFSLWIDLGYSDSDWRGWAGYVDVYILTPVPADIDYLLPAS
jgi:uncharacterized protein YabE (DUF348 family)